MSGRDSIKEKIKIVIETIIIAFSMYSRIPMPKCEWNEKNMRYAICFFPFVGLITGFVMWGILELALFWGLDSFFVAVLMTCTPILINGGIHMDGFLDTVDALSSNGSIEKRLQILKDPNSGAFAVIYGIVYMLLLLGGWNSIVTGMMEVTTCEVMLTITSIMMLSRTLSGLSVVCFTPAKNSGLAYAFHDASNRTRCKIIFILMLILESILLISLSGIKGIIVLIIMFLLFLYHRYNCNKNFGGITGDLAGYFLQLCELFSIICVAVMLR